MPARKKPPGQKLDSYKTVRGTQADVESWEKTAQQNGITFGEWSRAWLNHGVDHHAKAVSSNQPVRSDHTASSQPTQRQLSHRSPAGSKAIHEEALEKLHEDGE